MQQLTHGIIATRISGYLKVEIENACAITGILSTKCTRKNIKVDDFILVTKPTIKELSKRIKLIVENQPANMPISYLIVYTADTISEAKQEIGEFIHTIRRLYGIETLIYKA